MLLYFAAFVFGLIALIWSADKFVDGAASVATSMGMSRLLVGMVIVGFGTSAPEMLVSALAAYEGSPGLALGNVFGSNIANIALILGLTILIRPIKVDRLVMTRELPILLVASLLCLFLLWDGFVSRLDAGILAGAFLLFMGYSIFNGMRGAEQQEFAAETIEKVIEEKEEKDEEEHAMPRNKAFFWVIVGLGALMASSRLLVWASVNLAQSFGVSDVIIGLTIVSIGTSLPELASAIAATRKNEHELVLGNIIGSNFFNTLAVIAIAGAIHPVEVAREFIERDLAIGIILILLLFVYGLRKKKENAGMLSRGEGFTLLVVYALYTSYLISLVLGVPLFNLAPL